MIHSSHRLELWFWSLLPSLLALLLVVISFSAKHIDGLAQVMPSLALIPVFYWGMTHAREMPYWFVFALGLLIDAISGLPLGPSSLLYMAFLGMLHAQRRYFHKEGFVLKWGYFALLLAAIDALHWLALSFLGARAQPIGPATLQWGLTVCCYPLLHKLFDGISEHIQARRWQLLHG